MLGNCIMRKSLAHTIKADCFTVHRQPGRGVGRLRRIELGCATGDVHNELNHLFGWCDGQYLRLPPHNPCIPPSHSTFDCCGGAQDALTVTDAHVVCTVKLHIHSGRPTVTLQNGGAHNAPQDTSCTLIFLSENLSRPYRTCVCVV